ncbi:MAG TPA: CoA-binding protein [bacterium]
MTRWDSFHVSHFTLDVSHFHTMKDIAALLDEPQTTIAVVGANDNPSKYGYVIYRDLKRKGYAVFAVNPNRQTVDGDRAFGSLAELPAKATIVNVVVPPEVTMQILKECQRLGLMNVWIQPGAESPQVLDFLQKNHFNYLANACIMVQSRMRGSVRA